MQDIRTDFLELLEQHISYIELEEVGTRSANVVLYEFILTATSLGLFSSLWTVLQALMSRYTSATAKITYESESGAMVEIVYDSRTAQEVENIVSRYPLKQETSMQIILSNTDK